MVCFLPSPSLRLHNHFRWRQSVSFEVSCCTAKSPPPQAIAARKQLVSLLSSTPTSANPEIDTLVSTLSQYATGTGNDLSPDTEEWRKRLFGKWRLVYTTETPLMTLINDGIPFLSTGDIYQLVTEAKIMNIIEFPALPAVLSVDVEYSMMECTERERRCDFTMVDTTVSWGKAARQWMKGEREGGWKAGWALGKGFFRTIWLDEVLRIDRDTSGEGRDWVNCYVYGGPVETCTVEKETEQG